MPIGSNLLTLLPSSFRLRHLTLLRLTRYTRHPIAAFSSAAVSHTRLHSAYTRPNFSFRSTVANQFHAEAAANEESGEALNSFPCSNISHPWPEWSKLSSLLVEKGYSDRCISSGEDDDSFSVDDDIPEEFLRSAKVCLGFARDRPDILRLLTKKNIEAVVLNGSPFLFKNGENSSRRIKLFFNGEGSSELELEKAETVDVMRYLLSYAYGSLSSSDINVFKSDELVEKSARKLLDELYNLSGTVWKSKLADAYLMNHSSSNEEFSRSSGQDTEMTSINSYAKFVAPSFVASESQSSGPSSFTDVEYGRSSVNQKQGPEEAPVNRTYDGYNNNSSSMNMNHTGGLNALRSDFDAKSAEPSSSFSTFNSNSAESSTSSGQPPSHFGNNYNSTDNGQRSDNLWRNSNTLYDGSTTNSYIPHEKPWSTQLPYNNSYNANATPPFSNSPSNNSSTAFYGGPTTPSSPSPSSPGNYWDDYRSSHRRDGINSTPPSNHSSGNNSSSFFYGRPASSSSQPLSNSWDNRFSSTPPSSSTSWSNDNATNSPQAARDPWSDYNTSDIGKTTNSTPPSSNSWDNNRSTDYRSNYNTRYDEFVTKSTQTSSSLGISDTSNHGLSNSSNSTHTSFGASSADNSSQPPPSFMNKYDTSPKISAQPIGNPWTANNSYAGSTQGTYRGYAENSTHPSGKLWNSNTTTYSAGPTSNPAHPSDRNTWNTTTTGESWSGGFPQSNTQKNSGYGYSGKSLEGSCVKEPDPLDMSEEAKAERWFRRAAQIKDISELSQIPDEDFPQIMPMRKGVNRFVISKRKTPLERRLTSQQYRRTLPVVSSEPGKETAVGESTANDSPDSGL